VLVTWEEPDELEKYIFKLHKAAEILTNENRKLRKQHSIICGKVVDLMSVDLMRNQQKWKEILSDIRSIINSVQRREAKGNVSSVRGWRAHWNHQLYKALEHQYQMGLHILTQNLPEIKVDLVFRQGSLQFRPTFEEIRARFYKEIRRFIAIPSQFRGVTESGDDVDSTKQTIFKLMVERNSQLFYSIFNKAEDLFRRLKSIQKHYEQWLVLGKVDLEAIINNHCNLYVDFETNFRLVKLKGKEVEKLPVQEKIDCISISIIPCKSSIEDQLTKLFDLLVDRLRNTIHDDVTSLGDYVTMTTSVLQSTPSNIEEMSRIYLKYEELKESISKKQNSFDNCLKMDSLLRKMAGSGVGAIMTSFKAKWESMAMMIENYKDVMEAQKLSMKTALETRVTSFISETKKFTSRWQQFKPGDDVIMSDDVTKLREAVKIVNEKKKEFEDLKIQQEKLSKECSQFSISLLEVESLDDLQRDIYDVEKVWVLYEDFHSQLDEMKNQDWISFRGKCYEFDDMLQTWDAKLRKEEATVMSAKIQRTIDDYKDLIPCLKFLRGEHLSNDHWLDLFRLIELSRGTTLEKLTFGNLLQQSSIIVAKIQLLKELNSRAQGEVSIREALRELEVWGVGATFQFTDFQDSHGNLVKLIKEWKDLLNEVCFKL